MLVVGEGLTERCYFNGVRFEDNVREAWAMTIKKGKGKVPQECVKRALFLKEEAESREQAFDRVVCVLDVEIPDKRKNVGTAITLAKEEGIELVWSNPCFEVWLLSHFKRTGRCFKDAAEVVAYLGPHWAEHCGQEYSKTDERMYSRIAELTPQAIKNAKDVREKDHAGKPDILDCNSATDVYRLVEALLGSPS